MSCEDPNFSDCSETYSAVNLSENSDEIS